MDFSRVPSGNHTWVLRCLSTPWLAGGGSYLVWVGVAGPGPAEAPAGLARGILLVSSAEPKAGEERRSLL